jgi:hypothetical protein
MFLTARQLEDLHRANGSNGHLVLPYRARLTPLAADWVRSRKIALGYSDDGARPENGNATAQPPQTPLAVSQSGAATTITGAAATAPSTGAILWWCDGPCGPAKAALVTQSKESPLRPIELPAEPRQTVPVIRALAGDIKAGRAAAGVLLVQSAAAAMVYANRCPSLRAIVGTCLEAVEQGIQQVAANVLVIEHPHRTLHQVKSMLARFARAGRELPHEVRRELEALAACQ